MDTDFDDGKIWGGNTSHKVGVGEMGVAAALVPGSAAPAAPVEMLAMPDVVQGNAIARAEAVLAGWAQRHSLAAWAARYLSREVHGVQSPNTFVAKRGDLLGFVGWFVERNGHGDIDAWLPRDTQVYLGELESKGRGASSVNRAFATLRRFARWVHEQPGNVFGACGLPTRGIKELAVDEPDCKKFDARDMHRLFGAADRLVFTETRKNARPRRNRGILALLYYSGLRVGELVALRREQYDGGYLLNVKRKGKARSKGVYVSKECRRYLDDYLQSERPRDAVTDTAAGLFLPVGGGAGHLTRRMVAKVLDGIAAEASARLEQKIHMHPHRLRHSFGAEFRARTGSDTETAAALGHAGLAYVGRYVRRSQSEREIIYDSI